MDLPFILNFSDTGNKIWYFNKYQDKLEDDEYWKYLAVCYIDQDYQPVPYIFYLLYLPQKEREKKI